MSSTTATIGASKTNLHPLITLFAIDGRRRSSAQSNNSTISTLVLPSPSIVTARAYFLEQLSPIVPAINVSQQRGSLIEQQQIPRRHSVLEIGSGSVTTQLENFSFGGKRKELTEVPDEEAAWKSNSEDDGKEEIDIKEEELPISMPIRSRSERKSIIISPDPGVMLRQVPFEFTHGRLHSWGNVYLGNVATADAFVKAVSLRRPSMTARVIDRVTEATPSLMTIRARVIPKGKDKKPFLIQRQFDTEELRSNVLPIPSSSEVENVTKLPQLRRSSRIRRASTQQEHTIRTTRRESSDRRGLHAPPILTGAIPIHVEYALHYLPILAALMLSGHILKGDTVDLPLPHPEAWDSVISYIYTGKVPVTLAIRENILYLGGNIA